MSNFVPEAHELARSYDVFTDPTSYVGFDITSEGKRIVGCVDPRDEAERLRVIAQTGGGAVGKGLDAGFALTAYVADGRVYDVTDGMGYDSELEHVTVAGAHRNGCRFILSMAGIILEMTEPSDLTRYTMDRFIGRYELQDTSMGRDRSRIVDAARRAQDKNLALGPEELLQTVDQLYPDAKNVREMRGDNRAAFHILNHHPYMGLNRALIHRGEQPLTVHAYHDNIAAMVDSLAVTRGMPREMRDLRLAALLLRTAATRTVLCQGNAAMTLLNVVPTKHTIQVEREYI